MPGSRYKVRVTKDYLVFCSGHFITYAGDQCERIHGHNYRTAVEVEDDLDENHYVFDFIALKDLTRGDHRRARPPDAPADPERPDPPRGGRAELARPLPRPLTGASPATNASCCRSPTRPPSCWPTTSPAASASELTARGLPLPRVLRVEVEESFGQSAEVEWTRDGGARVMSVRIRSDPRPIRPSCSAEPTRTASAPAFASAEHLVAIGDAPADGDLQVGIGLRADAPGAGASRSPGPSRPGPGPGASRRRTPSATADRARRERIGRPPVRSVAADHGEPVAEVEAEDEPVAAPTPRAISASAAGPRTVSRPTTTVATPDVEQGGQRGPSRTPASTQRSRPERREWPDRGTRSGGAPAMASRSAR